MATGGGTVDRANFVILAGQFQWGGGWSAGWSVGVTKRGWVRQMHAKVRRAWCAINCAGTAPSIYFQANRNNTCRHRQAGTASFGIQFSKADGPTPKTGQGHGEPGARSWPCLLVRNHWRPQWGANEENGLMVNPARARWRIRIFRKPGSAARYQRRACPVRPKGSRRTDPRGAGF